MMNTYIVDDLSRGCFTKQKTVYANTPKQAAEIVVGAQVERVTSGGSIVVYGGAMTRYGEKTRSYLYEKR